MKLKRLFTLVVFTGAALISVFAQDKIAYANVELILGYMPEAKSMQQELQTYQSQLAKKIKIKEDYGRTKMTEYQEYTQSVPAPSDDDPKLKQMQTELQKLDKEIREESAKAENQILEKRQTLLEPILMKLNSAIDSVATAEGFTYVLNSIDGSGVSIVLKGPEENDLTKKIMIHLGIKIP